jgi:hypothetical protein
MSTPSDSPPLEISSIRAIKSELGESRTATNLLRYIKKLDTKTLVVENNYIDVDYLIDYSNFHSHLFDHIPRFTKRVHLFSKNFNKNDLENFLYNYRGDQDIVKESLGDYLGFFILKPIKNINGLNAPIGRSLLSLIKKGENCKIAKDEYTTYFYGIPFTIDTLPFQAKDSAVGLCATTSLWVLNKKMNKIFKTPLLSPFQITKAATEYVESVRFTSHDGLTTRQMLTFFKTINVDYNIVEIQSILDRQVQSNLVLDEQKTLVLDVVKAFIYSAELPLIANLKLMKKDGEPDAHAVVICGYRQSGKKINRLIIHDDAVGPFTEVKDDSSKGIAFSKWNYDWKESFEEIHLISILIPFNPSIRLSFNQIYTKYRLFVANRPKDDHLLHLASISKYKKDILKSDCKDKVKVLEDAMPRFLWIISTKEKNNERYDQIFDATAHYLRRVTVVSYQ